jgi:predicted HTH transcriptional regulator
MANTSGGYLVIGAVQDKKTQHCCGFRSSIDSSTLEQRIRQVCLDQIEERIEGISIGAQHAVPACSRSKTCV